MEVYRHCSGSGSLGERFFRDSVGLKVRFSSKQLLVGDGSTTLPGVLILGVGQTEKG